MLSWRGVLGLLLLTLACVSCGGSSGPMRTCERNPVDARDAQEVASVMGERTAVEGEVVEAAYKPSTRSSPTFLNFISAAEGFYVVIFGEDRGGFDPPPEDAFNGQRVCVTGEMSDYRGRPQIIVESPSQIEVVESVTPSPEPAADEPTDEPGSDPAAGPTEADERGQIGENIGRYFAAINDGRYADAWNLLTAERQMRSQGGFESFAEGHSTTDITDLTVRAVATVDGDRKVAWVTFTSRQAARFGPQQQVCTHWSLDYFMREVDTDWLIDRSVGHAGGSEGEDC